MKICPGCGTSNEDKNSFCISCNEKIEGTFLLCGHCGNKTLSSNKFCISCGNKMEKSAEVISQGVAEIPQGNATQKDAYAKNQASEIPQVPEITQASGRTPTSGENQTSEISQVLEKTQTSE